MMKQVNPIIIFTLALLMSCSGAKRAAQDSTNKNTQNTITKLETTQKTNTASETAQKPVVETKEITSEEKKALVKVKEEKELTKKQPQISERTEIKISEPKTSDALFDHATWDDLITQNVALNGDVNYKGFKSNWSALRDYIEQLGEQLPEENWSKEEKLAYWMNAYNAMTIDLILRNYPVASIKDIKNPWDQRLWKLGSKWYNLNEIEHQILRKMGDARIHFGINCASFSCPPLLNEAFTSSKVNQQLDDLAIRFINDTERNVITENNIKVSKIFTWFAKDFKRDGSLISFLNKYSKTPISEKAKKGYLDYNWNLNETIIK